MSGKFSEIFSGQRSEKSGDSRQPPQSEKSSASQPFSQGGGPSDLSGSIGVSGKSTFALPPTTSTAADLAPGEDNCDLCTTLRKWNIDYAESLSYCQSGAHLDVARVLKELTALETDRKVLLDKLEALLQAAEPKSKPARKSTSRKEGGTDTAAVSAHNRFVKDAVTGLEHKVMNDLVMEVARRTYNASLEIRASAQG